MCTPELTANPLRAPCDSQAESNQGAEAAALHAAMDLLPEELENPQGNIVDADGKDVVLYPDVQLRNFIGLQTLYDYMPGSVYVRGLEERG
ncbi:hypothetical protein CYMTET_7292 [Cymbomonas tetramitiformis]|uniref:Uncharacterized protein n=1 Tax=Cymbomonas tetramitiformis TaxID=36881 RepID=A0AAE0GV95_9CHLO|nr:hypothetical protein CYMTET_7292 [Cymbomonas tetramitiformis]